MSSPPLHPTLTDAKVLEMLRSAFDDADLEIVGGSGRADISAGTAKGENFSSELYKLDARIRRKDGKEEEVHWMVKLPINDAQRFATNRLNRQEAKELEMYQTFIPNLRKLIKEKGLESELVLHNTACPYGEYTDETSVIVMENAVHRGYAAPASKRDGLSLAHCRVVLDELAVFHAAAYAYMKQSHAGGMDEAKKRYADLCRDFTFTEMDPGYKALMDVFMSFLRAPMDANLVAIQDSEDDDYLGAVRRYEEELCGKHSNISEALLGLLAKAEFKFQTMCHGDCWFNNMLFKCDDDGTPVEVCLVDLAQSRFLSPCFDLVYFLFICATPELRQEHTDDLLKRYHQNLIGNLKKLGEDASFYTYQDVLDEYNQLTYFGFIFSFMVLPNIICRKEDAIGMEDFLGDLTDPAVRASFAEKALEQSRRAVRNRPEIKQRLGGTFKEAVRRGIFKM